MQLQTAKWKSYKISDLFDIDKASEYSSDSAEFGITPIVSTSFFNNGVVGYIDVGKKLFKGNLLTVACNGAAIGEAYYQKRSFYATADVNVLKPKFSLNQCIGLFLVTIIKNEKYRFNYGRKWGKDRMKETLIKLPQTSSGEPDWKFMENYIRSLPSSVNLHD